MFLRGAVILFLFADLKMASSAADEMINPVDLNHRCIHLNKDQPNKSPILLIHGMGVSLVDWDNVTEVLALGTGRRVCAVDLRNHGDSPRADRSGIKECIVDVGYFLDKQGIKSANIVGHSVGGKVAMHFTLNNPERVDSLVVEDMRPNFFSEKSVPDAIANFQRLQAAIDSVPAGVNQEDAERIILNFLQNKLREAGVNETIKERFIKTCPIHQVNGKWQWKLNIEALLKSMQNPRELLWTISSGVYLGPTLFIYGTASNIKVPEDEEEIMELFPNASLIPVEGAGHEIHPYYRQFTDEVIKMINEIK